MMGDNGHWLFPVQRALRTVCRQAWRPGVQRGGVCARYCISCPLPYIRTRLGLALDAIPHSVFVASFRRSSGAVAPRSCRLSLMSVR